MHDLITGIQQVGIGVKNAREAMLLYKEMFGMDVLIFDDVAEATLMTQYTGGEVHKRRATLTLNMAGGGGFEIWQFDSRVPKHAATCPSYGDIGIFAAIIKCGDIVKTHEHFINKGYEVSAIKKDVTGAPVFWTLDKLGNTFKVITSDNWFDKRPKLTGGVIGAVIGVTSMERALKLYGEVLGISEVVYDSKGIFDDTTDTIPRQYRKVLLRKRMGTKGAFSKLLGDVEIELVQCLDRTPCKIYENRYWGDCGFIHLCFDVLDMHKLKEHAGEKGSQFTVDSNNSFAMEGAAGRFCYVEDPDGTLIELVETHKVPVMKKYGLYLDLKKRDILKQLPNWMVKMLALSKVK